MAADQEPDLIVAVDYSGSTGGRILYWDGVAGVLNQIPQARLNADGTRFLFWDNECTSVSLEQLNENICHRSTRNGGTRPQAFAKWIIDNFGQQKPFCLYLITDGIISQSDVDELDKLVPNLNVAEAKVFIFGSENFSVSAPFTRRCWCEISTNQKCVFQGNTNIDFEQQYFTVDSFLADFEKIKETVMIASMGIDNEPMRAAVLKMKKLYLAQIAEANAGQDECGQAIAAIVQCLEASKASKAPRRQYREAMKHLKRLLIAASSPTDPAMALERKVCELLNLCSLKGQFHRTGLLNTNRAAWADRATDLQPDEVELLDATNQKFECPLILDNDVPVLLINDDAAPILHGIEKHVTDDLVSCPLRLIKNRQVVDKLRSRIDHSIGHYGFKQLFRVGDDEADRRGSGEVLSPMTRRPLLGGIPLGCDRRHVRLGDYVLSKMFTGGKLLGNPTLWLCAVYHVVGRKVEYLSANEEFMMQFQEHLLFRLRNYSTYLGLSGLPQYPLVKVPISVAVWYCVVSSELVTPDDVKCERFLEFFGISKLLMHLLDLLQFPYNSKTAYHRADVRSVFSKMLSHAKKVDSNFADAIRSLYQNHVTLPDGKLIFLDGGVAMATKNRYSRRLPINEVVYLASLADPTKKAGDIYIPLELPACEPTPATLWPTPTLLANDTLICAATMRPYLVDPRDGMAWKVRNKLVHGLEAHEGLSPYQQYIQFVANSSKFPTIPEFLAFLAAKYANRLVAPRNTLPAAVEKVAGEAIQDYEKAREAYKAKYGEEVTPALFNRLTRKSCGLLQRKVIEDADNTEGLQNMKISDDNQV